MSVQNQTIELCTSLRKAWVRGSKLRVEEFLARSGNSELSADAQVELILTEFQLRQEAGETPEVAEYLRRFPNLQERLQWLLPLMNAGGESVAPDSSKDGSSGFEATHIGPVAVGGDSQRQSREAEDLLRKSPTIGPYKLLQQIGQGGMGAVFMAEQDKPVRRRVALKLIKLGMDSRDVITRFEAERQALAMMDHQNIAKVLDAGTSNDGRPYFVMELVNGIPITDYCDKFKLALNDRLGLFSQACKAIQHAHQKGIIHRDIKPSNVLVTQHDGVPIVKVIDFGLAKAMQSGTRLTDKTMFTEFGQVVGTLQYMSPEQAELNALDVDTRSDVYSLGVLLYELLTGSTPIEKQTLKEMALDRVLAAIREQEPPRPSFRLSSAGNAATGISEQRRTDPRRLSLILKGDLDWIAMKALEKDRTRRYDSPAQLAEDVQRYLSSEAINARPPSVSYRLRKTLRKHRVAVGTGAVVLASLIAGIVGTAVMWRQAVNANAAVESEKNKAIALASQRDEEARKSQAAAFEAAVATKQAQRAAFDAEVAAEKARHAVEQETAQRIKAEKNAKIALRQLQLALHTIYATSDYQNSFHIDPATGIGLAEATIQAFKLGEQAKVDVVSSLDEVIEQFRSETEIDAETEQAIFSLAEVLVRIAPRLNETQQKSALQAADTLSHKSIAIRRTILAASDTVETRSNLAVVLENSASLHLIAFNTRKQPADAEIAMKQLQEATPLRRKNCDSAFDETRVHELAHSLTLLSTASTLHGRPTDTPDIQRGIRDVCRRYLDARGSPLITSDFVKASVHLVDTLSSQGKWDDALREAKEQFETLTRTKEPGDIERTAITTLRAKMATARESLAGSKHTGTYLSWTRLELNLIRWGFANSPNNIPSSWCHPIYQSVGGLDDKQLDINTLKSFFNDEVNEWNRALSTNNSSPHEMFQVHKCLAVLREELGSAYYDRKLFTEAIAEFRELSIACKSLIEEAQQLAERDSYAQRDATQIQASAFKLLGYALLNDKQIAEAAVEFQRSIDLTRSLLAGELSLKDQNRHYDVRSHINDVGQMSFGLSSAKAHSESVSMLESVISWGRQETGNDPSGLVVSEELVHWADRLTREYVEAKHWPKALAALETQFDAELKAIQGIESPTERLSRLARFSGFYTLSLYNDGTHDAKPTVRLLTPFLNEFELLLKSDSQTSLDMSICFHLTCLGNALISAGEFDLSERLARTALMSLDRHADLPDVAKVEYYRNIGKAYEARGNYGEAASWYRRGLNAFGGIHPRGWATDAGPGDFGRYLLRATFKLKGDWGEVFSACTDVGPDGRYSFAVDLVHRKTMAEFDLFMSKWEEQQGADPNAGLKIADAYWMASLGFFKFRAPGNANTDLANALRCQRRLLAMNPNVVITDSWWPNYSPSSVDVLVHTPESCRLAEQHLRELQSYHDAKPSEFPLNSCILLGTVLAHSGRDEEALSFLIRGFDEIRTYAELSEQQALVSFWRKEVGRVTYMDRHKAASLALFEIIGMYDRTKDLNQRERWCRNAESLFTIWLEDGCIHHFNDWEGDGHFEKETYELFERLYSIWKKPERLQQLKTNANMLKAEFKLAKAGVQSAMGPESLPLPLFRAVQQRIRSNEILSEPVRERALGLVAEAYVTRMVEQTVVEFPTKSEATSAIERKQMLDDSMKNTAIGLLELQRKYSRNQAINERPPLTVALLSKTELCYSTKEGELVNRRFDGERELLVMPQAYVSPISISITSEPQRKFTLYKSVLTEVLADGVTKTLWKFDAAPHDVTVKPDGSLIAWCKPVEKSWPELLVQRFDGSDQKSLGAAYDPVWSHDGHLLIFLAYPPGEKQIKCGLWDGATTEWVSLQPFHDGLGVYPVLSPDEKQIAFGMKGDDGRRQIGLASRDGKTVRQATHETGGNCSRPAFSPDGKWLAYVCEITNGECQLSIVNIETTETLRIADDAALLRPIWQLKQ